MRAAVTGALAALLAVPALASAATWTSGAPRGVAHGVAVGDPGDADHVVLRPAFDNVTLFVTRDGGTTWARREVEPLSGFEQQLVVFPGPPAAIVLLDGAGQMRRSIDDGRTWTTVSERVVAHRPRRRRPRAPAKRQPGGARGVARRRCHLAARHLPAARRRRLRLRGR